MAVDELTDTDRCAGQGHLQVQVGACTDPGHDPRAFCLRQGKCFVFYFNPC